MAEAPTLGRRRSRAPIDPARLPSHYAIRIADDTLVPDLAAGDIAQIEAGAPCRPGDVVLIWLARCAWLPGEPRSILCRLAGRPVAWREPTPSPIARLGVPIELGAPPEIYVLRCDAIAAMHRCAGSRGALLGFATSIAAPARKPRLSIVPSKTEKDTP